AGLGLGIGLADGSVATGEAAWLSRYGSWSAAGGLGSKVAAFVDGSANFLTTLGIPLSIAVALMGDLVASFDATTLDTVRRLQRYVVQELVGGIVDHLPNQAPAARRTLGLFGTRFGATAVAVATGAALAALPPPGVPWQLSNAGSGGLVLWPLFGATNQLLA